MRKQFAHATALVAMFSSTAASAGQKILLQPVQQDGQAIRFDRGQYVVDLPGRHAAVQLHSVDLGGGAVAFDVGVFNLGRAPFNVDIGDIRVDGLAEPIRVLTRAELQHRAENRARWAKVFTVLGTSLAAAASAQNYQRNYYHVTTTTPYGNYHSTISGPCNSCQTASFGALLLGSAQFGQIQARLDQTRADLNEHVFQLSTVMPGDGYGGRVFLTRFRPVNGGTLRLVVNADGESFAFAFRLVPEGTPAPAYRQTFAVALPTPVSQPSGAAAVFASAQATTALQPATPVRPAVAIAAPAAFGPQPALPVAGHPAGDLDWHRYYATLIDNGVSNTQAKDMADQQFGPIG